MRIITSEVLSGKRACFTSAPDLNLTMVADGERLPKVIDAAGVEYPCGITAPTYTPTVADVAGGTFSNTSYVCYKFVYASSKFPFVEHAITAGGQIYPRSNASPASAAYKPASSSRKLVVTVEYSQEALVDKILIYRTDFFDTSDEATTAAEAGQMTYVGVVDNYNMVGTTTFTESDPYVGGEDLSLDNFVAPIFKNVCYVEPYFYAGGNDDFIGDVYVSHLGEVTLTSGQWRDGRNGQIATFTGIDSQGFDDRGSFYFKWTSNTTAQLYLDSDLTTTTPSPMQGTTKIRITGYGNILYRSQARNPFAWGITEVIDDVIVPKVFNIRVGGGNITSIIQLNGANLLKVDTVNPTACYTFNLRAQDTVEFASTRRSSAGSLSAISSYAQVEVQMTSAGISTLAFDANSNKIYITDGSNVEEVSDVINQRLGNTSDDLEKRGLISAVYNRDTDLALFFLPQKTKSGEPDCFFSIALGFHAGFKQWYSFLLPDITASATIEDTTTGRRFTAVGSEKGKIGILFDSDEDKYSFNWIDKTSGLYNVVDRYPMNILTDGTLTFDSQSTLLEDSELEEWVGMWGVLTTKFDSADTGYYARYLARIASWVDANNITFDLVYDFATDLFVSGLTNLGSVSPGEYYGQLWMGSNPVAISKTYMAQKDSLKAVQFWITYDAPTVAGYVDYSFGHDIDNSSVEVNRGFQGYKSSGFTSVSNLTRDLSRDFNDQDAYNNRAYIKQLFPVDTLHGFMLTFSQFGYVRHTYIDIKFSK